MAFLRPPRRAISGRSSSRDACLLRTPPMGDYPAWAELGPRAASILTPWEPLWARDELSRSSFRRRVRQYQRELREDLGYALPHLPPRRRTLVGGLTHRNVRRGVTQAASLGYWIGAPYVGQGYMTEAVRAVIPFAFDQLGLHRLEAACLPHQRRLVTRAGEDGFQARGHRASLLADQRRLARPPALRPARYRYAAISRAGHDAGEEWRR